MSLFAFYFQIVEHWYSGKHTLSVCVSLRVESQRTETVVTKVGKEMN